jgi:hypothetical protein
VVLDPGADYVAVVSWNANASGGAYQLQLGPSEVELLQDGIVQSGTLDFETFQSRHYFRGEAGQAVRITVGAHAANFSPAVGITTTEYVEYLFSSEADGIYETSVALVLPANTVYVIEITAGDYDMTDGSYTVQVDWLDEEE